MIQLLDQKTINQIAAGEVIERPSSVVKELMENSIDSGASAITVEIKDGGLSLIRITDNGSGIPKDEVRQAFLRHATSKITRAEDLLNISSLGFRGEALASIAAVAQVEIITKTKGSLTGCRFEIHGGKEQAFEEIGCPEGTTLIVRNLFYNTPARKKFMKSAMTEGGYIQELVMRLAMSKPQIGIQFILNGQNKLSTPGNGKMKEVIYQIYGRDITSNLLEINAEDAHMRMTGYIGKPFISRGNRLFENYFVNGRYMKNNVITKAIEEAYRTFVMIHKFPFTSLCFALEPSLLDINVHPTKMEMRYQESDALYRFIYRELREALLEKELIPKVTAGAAKEDMVVSKQQTKPRAAEPFEAVRRSGGQESSSKDSNNSGQVSAAKDSSNSGQASATEGSNNSGQASATEGSNNSGQASAVKESINSGQTRSTEQKKSIESDRSWGVREDSVPYEAPERIHLSWQEQSRPAMENAGKEDETRKVSKNFGEKNEAGKASKNSGEKDETERVSENSGEPDIEKTIPESTGKPEQMTLFEDKLLSDYARPKHRLIGQLFKTYWLIEYEKQLFIMDQHAAHEKVMYERFMRKLMEAGIYSQQLYPPKVVTLSPTEEAALQRNTQMFERMGFAIEPFGGKEYTIRAVPEDIFGIPPEDVFSSLIADLSEEGGIMSEEIFVTKLSTMACKAAVKGNTELSVQEANALIDELLTLENPYNCPHGRPTIISMSETEIEKKFKRIQD